MAINRRHESRAVRTVSNPRGIRQLTKTNRAYRTAEGKGENATTTTTTTSTTTTTTTTTPTTTTTTTTPA